MDDTLVRSQAVSLIRSHLGAMTAGLYQDFYRDKAGEVVLVSTRELLSEVIGEEKADKEIKEAMTPN